MVIIVLIGLFVCLFLIGIVYLLKFTKTKNIRPLIRKKYFIMAGNLNEARDYAINELNLNPKEFIYLQDMEQILGVNKGIIYLRGNFFERKNYKEIIKYAKLNGLEINR